MSKSKITILSLMIIAAIVAVFYFTKKTAVAPTPTTDSGSVLYNNQQYGFSIWLPETWRNYSIVTEKWQAFAPGSAGDKIVQEGPQILIRHPLWTDKVPRQDIPVMVFTKDQWGKLQSDQFHIGAAPINPSELGQNAKYVFGLPARYNYAFPAGYEEVDQILQSKTFQAY